MKKVTNYICNLIITVKRDGKQDGDRNVLFIVFCSKKNIKILDEASTIYFCYQIYCPKQQFYINGFAFKRTMK